MPNEHAATIVDPRFVISPGESGPFPFDLFGASCLAQGDSWFSIGTFPPGLSSNVLAELELAKATAIVNCARPGKVLQHMVDTTNERLFVRLLSGNVARRWGAILISGGGNDLIDAASVGPAVEPTLRLLSTQAELGSGPLQGDDYISNAGWQTFATHLTTVFNRLVDRRDGGINRHVPMFFHTYAHIVPRDAPAGPSFGPWLRPSLLAFSVPRGDWSKVSDALIDRLARLLQSVVAARQAIDPDCALHIVDTRAAPLQPADPDDHGGSGDFINEIHLTRDGYEKVADVWKQSLNQFL